MRFKPEPDRECPRCPANNRFLKHVETKHRQIPTAHPDPEFILLAIYQCEHCRGFDVIPLNRSATAPPK